MPPTPTPAPSIVNSRMVSALPLRADEEVLFKTRFHIVILIFRLLIVAGISVGLLFIIGQLNLSFLPSSIATFAPRIPLFLGGFLGLIFILNYLGTQYLLTTRRAQARSGIISFGELNIALTQIDNVQTNIGLLGLLFHFGTIRLASGNSILVVTFAGIPDAKRRGDQIEDLVAQARSWS